MMHIAAFFPFWLRLGLYRKNPENSWALRWVLLGHRDYRMADGLLEELRNICSEPQPIALVQMRLAMNQGHYEKAIQIGADTLHSHPRSPRIVGELASSLANSGQSPKALQIIEAYHDTFEAPVELLEKGLKIANKLAPPAVVIEWTQLVLSVDPKSPFALGRQFQNLMRRGKEEEARKVALSVEIRQGRPVKPAFDAVFYCIRCNEFERASSLLAEMDGTKAFRFETKLVSALLSISSGDLFRASDLLSQAAKDKNADRRLAVALLQLSEAHTARGGKRDKALARKFTAWGDRMYSEPISDSAELKINNCREKLNEVLSTTQSQCLLKEQPNRVSFICPVHRADDVQNIVRQVSQQRWRNAEVIFFPNGEVSKGQILEHWDQSCEIEPIFVERDSPTNLGEILNEAVDASHGEYICRMDADCLYFPDYTGNMMCCLAHFKADVAVKVARFRYLQALETVTLNHVGPSFEHAKFRSAGGGATFFFHRSVFEKTRFEPLPAGEDTWFLAACQNAGSELYYVDPFNFLSVRSAEKNRHAWNVTDAQILLQRKSEVFRNSEEFLDFVGHPSALVD